MGVTYRAVQWNPHEKAYDAVLLLGVVLFLGLFVCVGSLLHPETTVETLLIRTTATAALLLLHGILCIGPLCRLDPRFLPLLYNRHDVRARGRPRRSVDDPVSRARGHEPSGERPHQRSADRQREPVPFQPLGFAALVLLFLMAATSHDFWLAHLSAPVWKALHMGVYVAYALLVGHVALGILQGPVSPLLPLLLGAGMISVLSLHLLAARQEASCDRTSCHAGKVHRACAVRCISSGTPPVLALRGDGGALQHLLIVGSDGRSIGLEILDRVAEEVEVRGRVTRIDQLLVLWVEPEQIRRL